MEQQEQADSAPQRQLCFWVLPPQAGCSGERPAGNAYVWQGRPWGSLPENAQRAADADQHAAQHHAEVGNLLEPEPADHTGKDHRRILEGTDGTGISESVGLDQQKLEAEQAEGGGQYPGLIRSHAELSP